MSVEVTPTPLPGVLLVRPAVHRDERGWFLEVFRASRFVAAGLPGDFPQDNLVRSRRGVLRGLHYQQRHPQGKLVGVLSGEILDVAVDVRRGSPTFGRSHAVELRADRPEFLWVPPGMAHGYCVLSEEAVVLYKCTTVYRPEDERGVLWSDPSLGIDWRVRDPVLSPKDRALAPLDAARGDLPEYAP